MDNTNSIYLESDYELLDLIKFHQDLILYGEQTGTPDPDRAERKEAYKRMAEQIHLRAQTRMENQQIADDEENDMLDERMHVNCATCKQVQAVMIIDEHRHQALGSMHDVVQCVVCDNVFLNVLPNNWEDRTIYFDYMIEFLSKKPNEDETAEQEQGRLDARKMMQSIRETNLRLLEDNRKRAEANQKAEDIILKFRDMLLQGKVSLGSYGNNQGMA